MSCPSAQVQVQGTALLHEAEQPLLINHLPYNTDPPTPMPANNRYCPRCIRPCQSGGHAAQGVCAGARAQEVRKAKAERQGRNMGSKGEQQGRSMVQGWQGHRAKQ